MPLHYPQPRSPLKTHSAPDLPAPCSSPPVQLTQLSVAPSSEASALSPLHWEGKLKKDGSSPQQKHPYSQNAFPTSQLPVAATSYSNALNATGRRIVRSHLAMCVDAAPPIQSSTFAERDSTIPSDGAQPSTVQVPTAGHHPYAIPESPRECRGRDRPVVTLPPSFTRPVPILQEKRLQRLQHPTHGIPSHDELAGDAHHVPPPLRVGRPTVGPHLPSRSFTKRTSKLSQTSPQKCPEEHRDPARVTAYESALLCYQGELLGSARRRQSAVDRQRRVAKERRRELVERYRAVPPASNPAPSWAPPRSKSRVHNQDHRATVSAPVSSIKFHSGDSTDSYHRRLGVDESRRETSVQRLPGPEHPQPPVSASTAPKQGARQQRPREDALSRPLWEKEAEGQSTMYCGTAQSSRTGRCYNIRIEAQPQPPRDMPQPRGGPTRTQWTSTMSLMADRTRTVAPQRKRPYDDITSTTRASGRQVTGDSSAAVPFRRSSLAFEEARVLLTQIQDLTPLLRRYLTPPRPLMLASELPSSSSLNRGVHPIDELRCTADCGPEEGGIDVCRDEVPLWGHLGGDDAGDGTRCSVEDEEFTIPLLRDVLATQPRIIYSERPEEEAMDMRADIVQSPNNFHRSTAQSKQRLQPKTFDWGEKGSADGISKKDLQLSQDVCNRGVRSVLLSSNQNASPNDIVAPNTADAGVDGGNCHSQASSNDFLVSGAAANGIRPNACVNSRVVDRLSSFSAVSYDHVRHLREVSRHVPRPLPSATFQVHDIRERTVPETALPFY